jgi:hypothetical protein
VSSERPRVERVEGSRTGPSPALFVVNFEHARRSFKCVRLDLAAVEDDAPVAEQWVVTVAGRPVWSFRAEAGDTRESVQSEVTLWWDSSR